MSSTVTTGVLPTTQGMPGLPGLTIFDPNANLNTQFGQPASGGLKGEGLFAAQRYYFTWNNSSPTPAVQYSLPNTTTVWDYEVRWSAKLTSGTGVSGSGRILFSATGSGGSVAILTSSVLMQTSPGPAVTISTPVGSLL
jgi:hypothetical protein